MAKKDKNDRQIARILDNLEYEFNWEDYTENKEINKVLSIASKTGEGNRGIPDHIYVNEHKKLLIIIEDKSSIGEHISNSNNGDLIDTYVLKAITNSNIKKKSEKIQVFDNKNNFKPSKYAVDGIIWYMSFFKQSNIKEDIIKNYFLDWRIVGIAISGDLQDLYNHRISTYILIQDEVCEKVEIKTIMNEDDYINIYNNAIEEDLISNITNSSKKINKQLRSIDSQKRPILLSALMICLFEYDNKNIDNSFIRQYKSWNPATIAEAIQPRVDKILKEEGIMENKRAVINTELGFVKQDTILTTTNVLIDILDELRTNVISKFQIISNYDIIGKFYEEFLRFAGVSNVKKGIVLTPHHITTLFTELIPIDCDDVILDPACGTGAFLIAGMNKLLQLHEEIQNKKTMKLINKIEDSKDNRLINIVNIIENINDEFDKNDENYSKLIYSDTEKNNIAEKISKLNNKTEDNIKSIIYQERKLQAQSVYNSVKSNQLIGFEIHQTMYSLAISNMIFRGDGKSQIYYDDYFSENTDNELKKLNKLGIKPTIGFVNPPYGGKDNSSNPTKKEIQFLQRLLGHVSKYVIMIAPLSTYFKENNIRKSILSQHTLKYVINMPGDLFLPNAASNTAISVFEVGIPHGDKEVIFYDLKDDGYVLTKNKGRTDICGKWKAKKEDMLDKIKNPDGKEDNITLLKSKLKDNDEWLIYAHSETDYKSLSEKDFISAIEEQLLFEARKELDLLNKDITELNLMNIVADYYNKNNECNSCSNKIDSNFLYCPYCGQNIYQIEEEIYV